MNPVLTEILATRMVRNGADIRPLAGEMSEEEGALIGRAFAEARPKTSIEVGLSYGISALYACDALRQLGAPCRHIVMDPNQTSEGGDIGLRNIHEAGFDDIVEFYKAPSEYQLPKLAEQGVRVQAAIIDGWHTFDHTLIDFFYINRMLDVGGIIVLDDTGWPAIAQLVEHILTYPAYEIYEGKIEGRSFAGRIRRKMADSLKSARLRKPWEYPTCMAFKKIAEDRRNFDWHVAF